jgi:hypothetical protein
VVAAHEDPRRGLQQGPGRREEVGLERRPVVTMGAPGASIVARGTRILAIDVVANMDDQIGVPARRSLGDLGKGPLRRVVARLGLASFNPAASIADDDNAGGTLFE